MPNQKKLDPSFILNTLENYLIEIFEKSKGTSEIIFQEFDQLKNLISRQNTTPKNGKWFLYSDLFHFMLDNQQIPGAPLASVYTLLLANSNLSGKIILIEHKKILSEKLSKIEDKNKEIFLNEFGSNLKKINSQLRAKIKSSELLKKSIFIPKSPDTKKLSPIALTLKNNWKKY